MHCHSKNLISSLSTNNNMSENDIDLLLYEYDNIYGTENKFDENKFNQLVNNKKNIGLFYVEDENIFKSANKFYEEETDNGIIKIEGELNPDYVKNIANVFGNENIFVWKDNDGINNIKLNKPNYNIYNENHLQSFRDERDNDLYQFVKEEKNKQLDILKVLNFVKRNTNYNNLINALISENSNRKEKLLSHDIKIIIENPLMSFSNAASIRSKYKNRRAFYDAKENTIYINAEETFKNGDSTSVIMHEIMHAITVNRILNNEEYRKRFEDILNDYQEANYDSRYDKTNANRLEEFIANIWTDQKTIDILKKTKSKRNNKLTIWERIKEFFKEFLKDAVDNSLFEEATNELFSLLEQNVNSKSTERYFDSTKSENQIQDFYYEINKNGKFEFWEDNIKDAAHKVKYTVKKNFNNYDIDIRQKILAAKINEAKKDGRGLMQHVIIDENDKSLINEKGNISSSEEIKARFLVEFVLNDKGEVLSKKVYTVFGFPEDDMYKDVTDTYTKSPSVIQIAENQRKNNASIDNISKQIQAKKRLDENQMSEEEIKLKDLENVVKTNAISQLDPDSFDAKLNSWIKSTNFTSAQKYDISRNVMQTVSYLINLLVNKPEEAINIIKSTSIMSSINSDVIDDIKRGINKDYVIENIGFRKLFDIVKEYYFINNKQNANGVDEYGHSLINQIVDIINNFDAVLFCGRNTFTKLEKYKLNLFGNTYLTDQEIENIFDEESNYFEQQEESDNEAWQIDYDATSAIESISHEVLNALYTIPIKDENGEILTRNFGMPYFENGKAIAVKILDICYAQPTFSKMMDKLKERRDLYQWVDSIEDFAKKQEFKSKFYSSFRKDRINRTVLTLRYDEENDRSHENPIFEIEELSYDFANVQRNMENLKTRFNNGFKSDFFTFDKNKNAFINKGNLFNAYSTFTGIENELEDGDISNNSINEIFKILNNLGFNNVDVNTVKYLSVKDNAFIINLKQLIQKLHSYEAEDNIFTFERFDLDALGYLNIFEKIEPLFSNEREPMQYENGKSYYAFSNPTFVSDLIQRLQNKEGMDNEEYREFIENYYNDSFLMNKKYNEDGSIDVSFKNPILQKLYSSPDFKNSIKLINHLNIEDESYIKDDVRDMTAYLEAVSRLTFYFNIGRNLSRDDIKKQAQYPNNNLAYYKCGVFSNKTQSIYLQLSRISAFENDFHTAIGDRFFDVLMQELDRIRDVIQRARVGAYKIQNRDLTDEQIKSVDIYSINEELFKGIEGSGASFKYLNMFQKFLTGNFDKNDTQYLIFQKKLFEYINYGDYTEGTEEDNQFKELFKDLLFDKDERKGILSDEIRKQKEFLKELGIIGKTRKFNNEEGNEVEFELSPVVELGNTSKENQDKLLEDFFLNNFLNQIYINQLFQIDIAFTENAGDSQKRAAAFIAPGKKLDLDATFSVGNNTIKATDDKIQRTVAIKDEKIGSEAYDIIESIFNDEISKLNGADKQQIELYKEQILTDLKSYKEYKPADGQSWVSVTGAFKKLVMLGEVNEDIFNAYKSIAEGNINIDNLKTILTQPFKPVIYGFRNTEQKGLFENIKIPTYIKDSEFCIIVADALIRGSKKESMLTAISDIMEESAYTKQGDINTYNGIGIDNFTMVSAQKIGITKTLDLSKRNIDKYMSDNKISSRSEAIKSYIRDNIYIDGNKANGYNKEFVIETSFDDWRKQQDIPTHFRGHEQQWGSQERALTPMDINVSNFFSINGEEKTGLQVQQECNELAAKYVDLSVEELKNEFGLSSDKRKAKILNISKIYNNKKDLKNLISSLNAGVRKNNWSLEFAFGIDFNSNEYKLFLSDYGYRDNDFGKKQYKEYCLKNPETLGGIFKLIYEHKNDLLENNYNYSISRKEQNTILSNILKEQILDNDRYDTDLLKAVSLNEKGEFNIPLCDPMHATRIQQLINSIIKNKINKQKVPGAPIVQVSSYGMSEKLNIRWYKKDSNELLKTKQEWEFDKENYSTYSDYINDNKGQLAYHEVYMSVPWEDLYDYLIKEDGSIMTTQEAINKGIITDEMLYSIGYRIPTENKSSIYPMKIVGFMPNGSGDTIVLPDEIVNITGSDFDIDKTYIMFKHIDIKTPKFDTFKSIKDFNGYIKNQLRNNKDAEDFLSLINDNLENNVQLFENLGNQIKKEKDVNDLIESSESSIERAYLEFIKTNFDEYYSGIEITKYNDLNTKEGINNRMLDLHFSILRDESTQFLMFKPQGFSNLKRIINVVELLNANVEDEELPKNVDDILKLSLEKSTYLVRKLKLGVENENIMSFKTQVDFFNRNMNGLKLTGIFANHNTSHAFVQMYNNILSQSERIRVIYDEVLKINNISLNSSTSANKNPILDNVKDINNIFYISTLLGSFVGASVDIAKDDALSGMGIDPNTATVAALMARQGFNETTIGLMLNQPIVKKAIRLFNNRKNKSYTKLEDVVTELLDNLYKSINYSNKTKSKDIVRQQMDKRDNGSYFINDYNLAMSIRNYKENEAGIIIGKDGKYSNEETIKQAAILRTFNVLLKAGKNLDILTKQTKYNSIKSAVGPMIVNNIEMRFDYDDFVDMFKDSVTKPFTDSAKDIVKKSPLLKSLYEAGYGDNSIAKEIFSPYFVEYSDVCYRALKLFRDTSNKKPDNKTLKKFILDFQLYLLTHNKLSSKNSNNPFFNQGTTERQFNILSFAKYLNEIRDILDDYGIDNMFIDNLFEKENKLGFTEIESNFNSLDVSEADLIKSDLSNLINASEEDFEDSANTLKAFARRILLYFLQRNGFNYSPKTGIHIIPSELKILSGYANAINEMFNKINSIFNKNINEENFVNQFYMNNSDISKITPRINIDRQLSYNEDNCKYDKNTKLFSIKKGKDWGDFKAKNGGPIKAFNSKGQLFIYTQTINGYAVYRPTISLGQKFNYIEYDANTDWYKMTGVIDDIRTGNWNGLTKEQRKGLKEQKPVDNNIKVLSLKNMNTNEEIPAPSLYDEPFDDSSDYTYNSDAEDKNDYNAIEELVNIGMTEEQAKQSKKLSNLTERVKFANELIKTINDKYNLKVETIKQDDLKSSEPLKNNNLFDYLEMSKNINLNSTSELGAGIAEQVYSNVKNRVIDLINNKICK